jgi:hypothetical protein
MRSDLAVVARLVVLEPAVGQVAAIVARAKQGTRFLHEVAVVRDIFVADFNRPLAVSRQMQVVVGRFTRTQMQNARTSAKASNEPSGTLPKDTELRVIIFFFTAPSWRDLRRVLSSR